MYVNPLSGANNFLQKVFCTNKKKIFLPFYKIKKIYYTKMNKIDNLEEVSKCYEYKNNHIFQSTVFISFIHNIMRCTLK